LTKPISPIVTEKPDRDDETAPSGGEAAEQDARNVDAKDHAVSRSELLSFRGRSAARSPEIHNPSVSGLDR
jgi:hypothetical protein